MNDNFKWKADTAIIPPDVIIERQGQTIVRITKSGVVIWGQEPHNAGMLAESQLKEMQRAKERHMAEFARQQRANDTMVGGNHYKISEATGNCPKCGSTIEHWDWAHNLRALEYASTKYLARWRTKGGLESLKKVIHYVQKLIEIHFPDVVVTVQYTDKVGESRLDRSQKAGCGEGVAEGTASHQTALNRSLENGDQMDSWGPSS